MGTSRSVHWARSPLLHCALLLLAALLPRLWQLGRRSLWIDELQSLNVAAQSLADFRRALEIDVSMPLYFWLLHGWLQLVGFGASEALIRLPSALIGAACCPLLYLLGRRLHSARAGLAGALLLAANSLHVVKSQEARGYSLAATLVIATFLVFDLALRRERRRDWAAYGLLVALALAAHASSGLVVLAQGLIGSSRRSRRTFAGLILAGLVALGLLALLEPLTVGRTLEPVVDTVSPLSVAGLLDLGLAFGGGNAAAVAVCVGLAVYGLIRCNWADKRAPYLTALLLTWLLLPLLLVLGASLIQPIFRIRYLLVALPALSLLAGVGLAGLPSRLRLAVSALAIGASVIAIPTAKSDAEREFWRELVTLADARSRPGDGWIFVVRSGQAAFEYYAGWGWGRNPTAPYADVLQPLAWPEVSSMADLRAPAVPGQLASFAAAHPRIWLVLGHHRVEATRVDRSTAVQRWLASNGYQPLVEDFGTLVLVMCERPQSSADRPVSASQHALVGPAGQ